MERWLIILAVVVVLLVTAMEDRPRPAGLCYRYPFLERCYKER